MNYSKDTTVYWDWGKGTASGNIKEAHKEKVTKTIQGNKVTHEADGNEPAYYIQQEDGDHVLKSHSEVRKTKNT
ncbi:MAG: DUF2945 domain-containing protein [Candidatus Pacebacteria bacterium]|nr:DUF2945 domain-containing protein [Candidatus Paceibacterota bacterium]